MRKVTDKGNGVFRLRNGIAVQSTVSPTFLALPLLSLITVSMIFCMSKVVIDSFKLLSDIPAGLYNIEISGRELLEFWIVALIGCGCICAVNCLKKHSVKATLTVFFAAVLFFSYNYKAVANGFVHVLNKGTYAVALLNGERLTSYYLTPFESENPAWELKFFCIGIIWLTCFIVAFGVIKRCSVVVPVLAAIVYVTPPLMMYAFVGEKYVILFSVCCLVVFVMKTGGYNGSDYALLGSVFSKQKLFIKGKYVSKASFQQGLTVFICAAILLTGISVFYDADSYERSDTVEQVSKNITSVLERISSGGAFTFGNSSELNNGNIYQTGNIKYKGDIMFKIKQDSLYNSALYLRSYTAGGYDGKRWYEIPKKTYKKYDEMWTTFRENKFYPPFIHSYFDSMVYPTERTANITIQNENIDHRIFLNSAYTDILNLSDDSLANYFYDNIHKMSSVAGVESYTQSVYQDMTRLGDVFFYPDAVGESITDALLSDGFTSMSPVSAYSTDEEYYEKFQTFLDYESQYRKFVVENYTDYPEIIEEVFPSDLDCEKTYLSLVDEYWYNDESSFIDDSPYRSEDVNIVEAYYDCIISNIKSYLHENAEYTLTPGKAPYGEDFVEYFVNKNHKGYCVHFATAAALMLRKAGIPTRYVEGFYVSGSDLEAQDDIGYTNVPDSRAHAWVEAYYPLKGWQVVEFTPSYGADGEVPEENDEWSDSKESDTEGESDTNSEEITDSDTQTDTDEGTTDTESNIDSESDTESDTSQVGLISGSDDDSDTDGSKLPKGIVKLVKSICCIFAVILLWILTRFVYRKSLLKSFRCKDGRRGAAAVYRYALRLLNFSGFHAENDESELTFAKRVTKKFDILSDISFVKFTDYALKSRFGKEMPSRKDIDEMVKFTDRLSNDIYSSSSLCKKMIMKYFLFLH